MSTEPQKPIMAGQLTFGVDDIIGLVRVVGSGMWSAELVERHFGNLEEVLREVRRKHGRARTLVDLRDAAVQTAETALAMNRGTGRIYRPTDRVAAICATSLLAMQIRRTAQVHQLETFVDPQQAVQWLLSDEPAEARAAFASAG